MPSRLPNNITYRTHSAARSGIRVHIRRKGTPDYSHEFQTLTEACAKRDEVLGLVRTMQAGGADHDVTVNDAIAGYRRSPEFLQLANSGNIETRLRYWEGRLGTTPLSELSGHRLVKLKSAGATVCGYLSGLSVSWNWAHEKPGRRHESSGSTSHRRKQNNVGKKSPVRRAQ